MYATVEKEATEMSKAQEVAQKKARRDRDKLLDKIDDLSRQSENILENRQIAINEAAQAKSRNNWAAYNSSTEKAKNLLAQSVKLIKQAAELTTQVDDLNLEISIMETEIQHS